jgi:hypothetical protein
MHRLSKIVNVSKALGLTVLALGTGVYDASVRTATKAKKTINLSKEVYREAKSRLDYVEDIDEQAFAQGRESSYS